MTAALRLITLGAVITVGWQLLADPPVWQLPIAFCAGLALSVALTVIDYLREDK